MSDQQIAPFKTDYDVMASLHNLGHDVRVVGLDHDIEVLRGAIEAHRPHVVFNILEEFDGRPELVSYVLGYLELIGQAYTGCNPVGMMFSQDKALQRKILRHHRIHVPDFTIIPVGGAVRRPTRLGFPLIVKSLTEHGSYGISQASIVYDDEKLAERVAFVHRQLGTPAIAEQYIDGRELYLGLIGNKRLEHFPIWELRFENLPEGAPTIATSRVKWDLRYQKSAGVTTGPADLTDEQARQIIRMCKRAYRALDQTGYARMDMRMEASGKVYLIESNPNPQLSFGEDFAESAEAAGLDYEALLQRIVNLGLRR
jgi:D-alanine-D-alanine ligase